MSYSVTVKLDVNDYCLLRSIIKKCARATPLPYGNGLITHYKVKQLGTSTVDEDDLQDGAKYLLKQLPKKGCL